MKQFRLLRPDEIECRVSQCTERGVTLLLYKTARTDADLLDETVGASNWENDFKLVDGVLYGGIGVDYGTGTVWKWDAGTESNTEAEKGRASDAFKRAGFKHGIGRELYSAPFIYVPADNCNITQGKNGKPACYDTFNVASIGYDEEERISSLTISLKGKPVYTFGGHAQKPVQHPEKKSVDDIPYVCADCGQMLQPKKNKGTVYTIQDIDRESRKAYGKCLCWGCMVTRKGATDEIPG